MGFEFKAIADSANSLDLCPRLTHPWSTKLNEGNPSMRKALFTLALSASALILPLAAHADTIDDFVLTGNGHTITYSLPATTSFRDYSLFDFFAETAPTTIDGVTIVEAGDYYSPFFPRVSLILGVPSSTFGSPQLYLSGPMFINFDFVPASNPLPYLPFDVVPTFIPGTYTLHQENNFLLPLDPPVLYTLTITPEASAATPEPSSVALLMTGVLGLIGFAGIKRRAFQFEQ